MKMTISYCVGEHNCEEEVEHDEHGIWIAGCLIPWEWVLAARAEELQEKGDRNCPPLSVS